MAEKKETAYDRVMQKEAEKERLLKSKTSARKIADEMELERTYPMSSKMAKETPTMAQSATDALKGGLGIPLAMGVDMVTGPKRRSEEDMSELTREVARGNKMKKGGTVRSASSRGDGIAQRGKTRGRMV
jgi:hypothetical protein